MFDIENFINLFLFSYFSPLLKSVTNRADVDYVMIGEDLEERDDLIELLESRFLFLAADARSTLRLFNYFALDKQDYQISYFIAI